MDGKSRFGVVLLVGLGVLGGGVAYASWVNSGSGTATAQATTAVGLVVTPGTPVGTLYPVPSGGYGSSTVGSVYATVSNPNPYPVQITAATMGAVTITPQAGRTCAAGSVVPTTVGSMPLPTPIVLAANASATAITVPGAVQMIATAEDGCQGAAFSIALTLTGASA